MNHTLPFFDTINTTFFHCVTAIVLALFKQYFDIAFLMGKPQDLPAGESQLTIGVALNFVSYIFVLLVIGGDHPVMHAVFDIGLTGVLFYLALMATSKLQRFQQAFGGLSGASAVLNIVAALMLSPLVSSSAPDGGSSLGEIAYFVLLVWSLSLTAHVLRHTFAIKMVASIGIALGYYILISTLLISIWPNEEVEAQARQVAPSALGVLQDSSYAVSILAYEESSLHVEQLIC